MGSLFDFTDTSKVSVPPVLIEQIIGQEEAVRAATVAARQKRHLLLVGPPGTGKSMVAQAIASLLPPPTVEVSVLNNPAKPERPLLEIRPRAKIMEQTAAPPPAGLLVSPEQVPDFVSERLGYRCRHCAAFSDPDVATCPSCAREKFRQAPGPFDDLLSPSTVPEREDSVSTTRVVHGHEDLVVFERSDAHTLRALDQKDLAKLNMAEGQVPRNIILSLDRSVFVQATGASQTELLGDVRHDPYGSHPQIGSPPYSRVVPGAVHEAHEGVLFVDELVALGRLQRHLLTAMQEKRFPISGRNASSTGASVRVDHVPCDFILVAAVNTSDLGRIMPALRSRINGNGYEVLVNSTMPDTEENRRKLVQFVAQEIRRDGRIPHATSKAVEAIIGEARARARAIDATGGLSLRLRSLSGIIKASGDLAVMEGAPLIEPSHVKLALGRSKTAEEQIRSRFGSQFKASMSDAGLCAPPAGADKSIG